MTCVNLCQDPIKRRQRGQSEALSERRLSIALLRSVFEDSQQPKFKKEGSIDVQRLAERSYSLTTAYQILTTR